MQAGKGMWNKEKRTRKCTQIHETDCIFTMKDQNCFCCGKKGHMVPNCPEKDMKSKSKWVRHKATQECQEENERNGQSENDNGGNETANDGN